jgi:hypothetical protein
VIVKRKHGKQWRRLAFEWEQIADMRADALQRVWLVTETIEDPAIQHEIRAAVIADLCPIEYLITSSDEEPDGDE